MEDRIGSIYKFVKDKKFDVVYDLCCDHGKIGEKFFHSSKDVIFVDQVDEIISKLKAKHKDKADYLTESILDLNLNLDQDKKRLFILAGVGSKLCCEFLQKHIKSFVETDTFIILPQGTIPEFLVTIHQLSFSRMQEYIIRDKSRFYEAYVLKLAAKKEDLHINKNFSSPSVQNYLHKQVNFYRHLSQTGQNLPYKLLYEQLKEIYDH